MVEGVLTKCAKHGIYSIIDLHTAPGGESCRASRSSRQVKIKAGTATLVSRILPVSLTQILADLSLGPQGLSRPSYPLVASLGRGELRYEPSDISITRTTPG